jgi:hypothetical protein|tara:strand:+ start:765 stop:1337 length:573 start_codon:yes stop_codon:yes gene_type:complete
MPKYFGTTNNVIDWDPIVDVCKKCTTGDVNTPGAVIDRSETEAEGTLLQSYRDIMNTWLEAGYKLEEIKWIDYYPGEHFDIEIQNKFAKIVDAQPLRVFVSDVAPGNNVPYHWDVEDKEEEWLAQGELKRWVCFIDKPRWGNVLVLEDEAFHNVEQGKIYEWDNYRSHHAGTSMGVHHQYLFHFLGRPNK